MNKGAINDMSTFFSYKKPVYKKPSLKFDNLLLHSDVGPTLHAIWSNYLNWNSSFGHKKMRYSAWIRHETDIFLTKTNSYVAIYLTI